MTRVYIIRHAEAEGNLYRRIHGRYDSILTDCGLRQTEALAERFKNEKIDAVYSSDMTRTCQTAEAIYKTRRLPLLTTPELRELALGVWEDKTWGEVMKNYPAEYGYFSNEPEKWSIPGGESFSDAQERIAGAVRKIAERHPGGTAAVFSHGSAIRAFTAKLAGCKIAEVGHSDNTAVSLVEYENGRFTLKFSGDNSHLPEGYSTLGRQTWWKEKSGLDPNAMRFEAVNPADPAVGAWYLDCYRDAWAAAHGTEDGFSCSYLETAKKHRQDYAGSVVRVLWGDETAGLMEFAVNRGKREGAGSIAFFYMAPEFRGRNLSVQLLGQAVSVYREMGRKFLRLNVAEENHRAIKFYTKYGFKKTADTEGALGKLFVMEKDISKPKIQREPVEL